MIFAGILQTDGHGIELLQHEVEDIIGQRIKVVVLKVLIFEEEEGSEEEFKDIDVLSHA